MKKILLVEDDKTLGDSLTERLSKEGYEMHLARSLAEAREKLAKGPFDLWLLDLSLPDGLSFDLVREYKSKSTAPIVFMTAFGDSENRLKGYELGAYEFIPKPFHLKELLLRLKHVFDNHGADSAVKYPGGEIDLKSMKVTDEAHRVLEVIPRDFQILKVLIEASPRVVTRDEILNSLWGDEQFPSPRTVDNAIVRLRQVLNDEQGNLIKSVRGMGYQWQGGGR